MMDAKEQIEQLAADFEKSRKILIGVLQKTIDLTSKIALGDKNRQHMILEMMKMGNCSGVRVNEITEKTHLSRPTVSHHLQILKDAEVLKVSWEGTKK